MYQIVWQRYFGRLLGNDHLATATTLGVFLAGLSLGFFLFGRLTLRLRRPLAAYAWLEALIATWALAFPLLFAVAEGLGGIFTAQTRLGLVVRATVLGLFLIGPPTVLMGSTLPLLTRGLARSVTAATRVQSLIYAVNTAGAALGALAAAFVLVHRLGLRGSLQAAAVLNLAAAAFFLYADHRVAATVEIDDPRRGAKRRQTRGPTPVSRSLLYLIAVLSGFYVMTLESVLVRFLGLSVGPSARALALIVAVFVLCIAAGATWVGLRETIRPATLALNQALACAGLMLLFVTLDKWPYWAHALRIRLPFSDGGFVLYHAAVFAALLLLLLLPVGCMGATLPLSFHLLKRDLERVGRDVGALFGWNALGSLLGGVGGGYLLQRVLLNGEIVLVVLGLTATTSVLAATWLPRGQRRAAWGVALVVLVFVLSFPAHDPLRLAVGTFRLREPLPYSRSGPTDFYDGFYRARTVLAYRDDPEGTFAVVENPLPTEALAREFPSLAASIYSNPSLRPGSGPRPRAIVINGKADSNTHYDRETLVLLAHLPAMLAERRERILLVGLGTGVSAGELTLYPDVQRIDVVEIAPGVTTLLPWFDAANRQVRDDPRFRLLHGDAFRVIGQSDSRWDVIVSQPSNPWLAGEDQLFSREFYRLVREHLEPDGLFLQWSQRYAASEEMVDLVLRTLRAEFDHVRVFGVGADDLLLASTSALPDAAFESVDRFLDSRAELREAMASIGIASAADLLGRERTGAVERAQRAGTTIETLDRPRLHHVAGRDFFRGTSVN